jgi:hypothetical protein
LCLSKLEVLVEMQLQKLNAKETALTEGEVESTYVSRRNTLLSISSVLRVSHAGMYVKENKE